MIPFEYIGDGCSRSVYRHGNYVIKLPLDDYGISANAREAHRWKKYGYSGEIPYARCRLLPNSGILVMEYARYTIPGKTLPDGFVPYEEAPDWTKWVDCQQVGYNRTGRLVAYDYGEH
jgi:hypothetical protein